MIRPLTIVTFLMACGSGLYLYQSKHEVQMLDKTIERTVHETSALRDQSRLLAAEWTMLNDPERLRQFSDSFLSLRSISPSQFTSLADLDSRLPAVHIEPPHVEEVPVAAAPEAPASEAPASEAPAAEPETPAVADEQEDLPIPPVPAAVPAMVAAAPHPVEHKAAPPKPAEPAAPRVVATSEPKPTELHPAHPPENRPAEGRTAEARTAEAKPAEARPEQHAFAAPPRPPAPVPAKAPVIAMAPKPPPLFASAPKPAPVQAAAPRPAQPAPPAPAAVAAASPYGGSLLGMARGTMAPSPRPMPVSSTQWSNTN
jgi:hypothetical protein